MNTIPCIRRSSEHLLLALCLAGLANQDGLAAEPQILFDGKDLSGWSPPTTNWMAAQSVSIDPADETKFVITTGNGILVNGPAGRAPDLFTKAEFGDLELHVEFCIPRHSNSGVYLMGRYEIQVYDSFGVQKDKYPGIECGGIYPRFIGGKTVEGHSPLVNASKAPGEWQTFDITFRAPRFDASGKKTANAKVVQIVHNGKVIHQNIELTGPTRGAQPDDEKPTGPLRLQGDHGPVAYRNLKLTAIDLSGK